MFKKIRKVLTFKIKKLVIPVTILILTFSVLPLTGEETEPNPFETPNCLKDNVAFWKKIYTEVSLKEGLLHDSEYPLVIYQKIYVGTLSGRTKRRLIDKYIDEIKQSLKIVKEKPQSLWGTKEKEIFALFLEHGDITDLREAPDRIRFQLGQKERFKEGLERAAAYMDYIRQVFKQYGIPERIAYLPHVESSFNGKAYSKVGATGIWQFMRRTGRLFMNVGYNVDERRDPFKSTVAAAKLLKLNYQELKSWPLAITAYNHGAESMKRASSIFNTTDLGVIIENYKDRRFRFASKNFYSCFLAASEIAAEPEKYFTDLIYHVPIQYNEITLDNFFKPAALALHLGISQDEIARLNPALLPTIFRHQMAIPRGFRLRIPTTITPETATQKIAAAPPSQDKAGLATGYQYYTVSQGDTLYGIAHYFGVSMEMILAANDIERENRLAIGQVLRIPAKNTSPAKYAKNTGGSESQSPIVNSR
ncbi:MAG TPA: transglycosylase SLT domain-containing protein [Candidatus Deferrimicrobium sp.]|nr:transglycosylase SLT domain-containing protein [Candidatus Deferrimicrobium sp.]